ncbi:phosphopentomutase [Marssonina coronariae]|uniref:Phosphopentomutase n=1 Tax=Diplocarpon coronariae TaxID=2795749 RepID=A0A218Z5K0_9HELO|nr:phosphopentomutase [Marssonina coronariae]
MVLGIARRFPTGDSRRRMLPCAVSNVHGGDDRGERLASRAASFSVGFIHEPRKSDRPRESKPFGRLRDTAPATIAVPTVWCLGRSTSEKLSPATRGSIPSKRTPACRIYPVMRLLRHAGSPVRQRVAVGGTISPSILPNDHPALRSAPPLATRLTTTTPHPSLDSHRRHGNTSARRPRPPPRRILIQESSLRSHTLPRCNETKQTKPKASAPSLGSSLAFRPLGFCYDTSPLSPAGRRALANPRFVKTASRGLGTPLSADHVVLEVARV